MLSNTDRQIIRLALPSIVSNITVPLLGLVDLAIVGHMGHASYIGAIAVGSMIFNVMYWLFGFLRMGTSGLTSQALGRRDLSQTVKWLQLSLMVSMSIALLLLLAQYPLRWIALQFMHPTIEVAQGVYTYYNICIWGVPAMLGLYSMTGWFIGMQNTRLPMCVAILQNIVNILMSLFLVYGCGMKVEGVALGTLIAQWSGFLLSLLLALRYYRRLVVYGTRNLHKLLSSLNRFFSVNRDIFFRTLCLVAVNLFFTAAGTWQGDLVLSVNTLLMTLFTLTSFVMDGLAYAGEALAGRYYGAHNHKAFQHTNHRLLVWGFRVACFFTLLFIIGGKPLLQVLTNDTCVIEAAMDYLPWAVAIPLIGVSAFIYDGIFIGITATKGMLLSTALAAVLFFVVWLTLFPLWGNHALWMALLIYLGMRGLVLAIYMKLCLKL